MAQPTLLSIARADLKTANRLVESNDKFVKHQAAFFTQQSIEKTIKYLVDLKTGLHPWGHDIDKLIMQAEQCGIKIPPYIQKHASVFTSWEALSRYYPQKVIRRDVIERAIKITYNWHKVLQKQGLK